MDRRLLSSWGMYNWLISGSLLGWYRQCGAIPYTSDADTASWASNFKPWMKDYFLGPDKGTCVSIHRNTITILSNVLKFKITRPSGQRCVLKHYWAYPLTEMREMRGGNLGTAIATFGGRYATLLF